MTTTPEQRAEWKAVLEKATPGLWEAVEWCPNLVRVSYSSPTGLCGLSIADCRTDEIAAAMVASRTALPALISDVDALEAENARLRANRERLERALTWYGENARLARLITREGDPGRHNLAGDGGRRARAAMGESE